MSQEATVAVDAHLHVQEPMRSRLVPLEGDRFTIGKAPGNALVLDDPSTSRLHAVCERAGPTWLVTDAGSTNGTWINGHRLFASHALRSGDQLRVGVVTLTYRVDGSLLGPDTTAIAPPPDLTPRERELLLALCRPVVQNNVLTEPASVREMARALSVSESAVKKSLGRIYSKFGLIDGDRRRGHLAIAAIRCGLVTNQTDDRGWVRE